MDPTLWGLDVWGFMVSTFNQLSGPYAQEFGIALAAVILIGIAVRWVLVPLRNK